jgi:ribose transport system ATP-binding protein
MDTVLRIEKISKTFPGVRALDNVDLDIFRGEIHAIVGENGAGKSTLMKILSGVYRRDGGKIHLEGNPVEIDSPLAAQRLGISIIHQELNLAQNIGIHQSIFMGRFPTKRLGFMDWKKLTAQCQKLLDEVQLDASPSTKVGALPVAQQQLVEIAKALSFNSRILIMDEPTSALNVQETERLFQIMCALKARGTTLLYISHRLEEIFQVADRITVMRDGKVVGTQNTPETNHEAIVKMMTGKTFKDFFSQGQAGGGTVSKAPLLEVKNLSQPRILRQVSFTLHRGEILGVAGLMGSGRTELVRAIFGADPPVGEIRVEGRPVRIKTPLDAVRHGIALLPEDRKLHGLLLGMSVRDNISFVALRGLSKMGFIRRKRQAGLVEEFVGKLKVKTPGPAQLVRNLSGGNQQKVVIAKWLAGHPKVLLLDDPTRGVDVGAKAEIYGIVRELARQGMGILFISSEIPEVLGISDRVILLRNGEVIAELNRDEMSEERVMILATGGQVQTTCSA